MKNLFFLSLIALSFTATAQPVLKGESLKKPPLTYICEVDINVQSNWINIISPEGTLQIIKFKNQNVNPYRLSFNVQSNLKNSNAIITNYSYRPISGGLTDFQERGVRIDPNGNLSMDCYMIVGSLLMKGQFIITYTEKPVTP